MSGTRSASTKAPATEPPQEGALLNGAALVVCSYGSGAGVAEDRVQTLGLKSGAAEAAAATLFGTPRIEDVVAAVCGSPIVVVPLFMARGATYGVLKDRLSELSSSHRIVLCPELGSHPGLAPSVAAHGWREVQRLGWRAEETGMVLVGHGSRRNPASGRSTARLARDIGELSLFADTAAAFLEEQPTVPEAVSSCPAERVLAIGCFIEAGLHATRDVPRGLLESGRDAAYSGPIGACGWIDDLVLDQARAGLRRHAQIAGQGVWNA